MSRIDPQTLPAARAAVKTPGPTVREAEASPVPASDSSDWHDQIKSASRLLAMALDRLGLDDRRDPLARLSQLYKKVSLAVFPPFKASLNCNHGLNQASVPAEHADAVADADDEDLALPLSDHHELALLLSVLATALACAGATSLKAIGSILHDRYQSGAAFSNAASDAESGETVRQSPAPSTAELDASPSPNSVSGEPALGHGRLPRRPNRRELSGSLLATMRRASGAMTPTSASEEVRHMYSSEILAKALTQEGYRPPPEAQRSAWENSVMANYNIQPHGDHVLIRYEPLATDSAEGSPDKAAVLKYHIALKLKETLGLHNDNYLHDHFDVWLAKDVLLQGHLYITKDAVCFYSLLPGKFSETELNDPESTLHAGPLGHKLAHYGESVFSSVYTNRFWAVLKPQTLSIYTSLTKLYFPVRTIDLRTALSCEILESSTGGIGAVSPSDSPNHGVTPMEPLGSQAASEISSIVEDEIYEETVQSGVWLKINCIDKSYRFHISSAYSARHWYNSISKAIFLLQNTNTQREVVLRIPWEDIVSQMKNIVLSGLKQTDPDDGNAPLSFSIEFNLPQNEHDSKLHRLKTKAKKRHDEGVFHDTAHFLVFQRGEELCECFAKVMEDWSMDSHTRNHKLKNRAKKIFHEERGDSMSPFLNGHNKVKSTVQPEFCLTGTIIDKIIEMNNKICLAREKEYAKMAEEQTLDRDGDSKKFNYVPNFKNMKDKLLPKTSPLSSIATMGEGLIDGLCKESTPTPSQNPKNPDYGHHSQIPKSFDLQMLRTLDVQMIKKRRGFKDIAEQYGILLDLLKTKRAKDRAFDTKAVMGNSETRLQEEESDMNSKNYGKKTSGHEAFKKGKFRSLKRLLRTVSTMGGVWSARPKHYDQTFGHSKYHVANQREKSRALNHFRNHFSLGTESHLVATYSAHLKKTVPVFGKLYVGKDQLCFRSMIPGVSTKMVLPLRDIQSCKKRTRLYQYAGLVVRVRGLNDLQLVFGSKDARDDCQKVILRLVRKVDRFNPDSEFIQDDELNSQVDVDETAKQTAKSDQIANSRIHAARLRLLEDKISIASGVDMPLILEDNPFTTTEVKLTKCYKITLLTIGSRGDVQPYIALGKALVKEGHQVTIATHAEFQEWINKHGIHFEKIAGNPAELMQLMVTHGSISVGFLKEASMKFRGWIGELLETSWKACQGAELLIESPSAMAGLHIAEALNIPYMRAFTMPWTRTRAYPHAFLVPDQNRGGSYNFLTHVMFENVFWKGISGQVNKWRTETLGLCKTSLVKMQQSRVPFLYNVSPAMFPPSVDFPDWVKVTGYWFLNEGSRGYEPPKDLVEFIDEARLKNEKIVYIGFGSIVVSDAKVLTKTIVEAVTDLNVKCILNKGWSDKLSKSNDEIEVELPSRIYDAGMIPHDWLFTKIDAAVHHGGSGTTGASLRAGLPTIIKPFFGDQFFFASRVEDLGAGIALKHLNKKSFTKALKAVTSERTYMDKAMEIGKAMSHERGVSSAIEAIYTELAYAKSLIQVVRNNTEQKKNNDDKLEAQQLAIEEEAFEIIDGMRDNGASEERI